MTPHCAPGKVKVVKGHKWLGKKRLAEIAAYLETTAKLTADTAMRRQALHDALRG